MDEPVQRDDIDDLKYLALRAQFAALDIFV